MMGVDFHALRSRPLQQEARMAARPSTAATASHGRRRTYPAQLLQLLIRPARALPQLQSRQSGFGLIGFPAVSGILVAYMVARGLSIGDRFGFPATAAFVVLGGAVLGMIALWFAGSLTHWSEMASDAEEDDSARMFVLFSEATWPFLPVLLIVVPLDLYYHGTTLFSATRDAAPAGVVWLSRVLILTAIGLWLTMMVRGTAVARHESEGRAARELLRWGAELLGIAVLFGLILAASLMYW
jgi:hypothetical protein